MDAAIASLARYRWGARWYDVLSGEHLLYHRGRETALELLDLTRGDRVLVVGCGTGLDLRHLVAAVGPEGEVVGVDTSRHMLRGAEQKVAAGGWRNVRLREADAAHLDLPDGGFDAVLFSYSLAIIDDWPAAWREALRVMRPGGQVAVVDTDLPTGVGPVRRLLAAAALAAGGVDRARRVWDLPATATERVTTRDLAAGHIRVSVGTIPSGDGSTDR